MPSEDHSGRRGTGAIMAHELPPLLNLAPNGRMRFFAGEVGKSCLDDVATDTSMFANIL
jgi:hypothetical protein